MGGSSTSGSSQTTSTQPYILSGLSQQAAQQAANAQISAANIAAGAVTQNSESAIQAMMSQYQTAMTYAGPSINTGNQAEAQMNYMLGLPAVSPGAAPTAPTLASEENYITPDQVNQYIQANFTPIQGTGHGPNDYVLGSNQTPPGTGLNITTSKNGGIMTSTGTNGAPTNVEADGTPYTGNWGIYSGVGALANTYGPNVGYGSAGNPTTWQTGGEQYQNYLQAEQDPNLQSAVKADLAQPLLQQAMPLYQTQLNQYNQENDLYNQYKAKGTLSASDISNVVDNMPGFQFSQQQGISGIQNAASASGMLNSGNILESLNEFGQGLSQQYYQQYMGNLASLAGMGQQSTAQAVSGSQNLGQNLASAYTNQGAGQANAALAAGQAAASMYTSPVANQQVMMYPYQTKSNTTSQSSSSDGGAGILSGVGQIAGLFCSRELKTSYGSVNTQDILESVNNLSLDRWTYKGLNQEHIGPYAEEFKELFGVGDGRTINMIDLFGVLLGAVKELSLKVKELQETK